MYCDFQPLALANQGWQVRSGLNMVSKRDFDCTVNDNGRLECEHRDLSGEIAVEPAEETVADLPPNVCAEFAEAFGAIDQMIEERELDPRDTDDFRMIAVHEGLRSMLANGCPVDVAPKEDD